MYLLLGADRRLKQNHKDVFLPAPPQELYPSGKESGLSMSQKIIRQSLTQCQNNWVLFFVMVICLVKMIERLNSGDWRIIFGTILCVLNIGLMKSGRVQWQEEEETKTKFHIVLTHQDKKFFTSKLFKVIQDAIPLILYSKNNVLIPNNFFEYIYHIGCAINLHFTTNSGLIPGREKSCKRGLWIPWSRNTKIRM